jgi:hypothetical protein
LFYSNNLNILIAINIINMVKINDLSNNIEYDIRQIVAAKIIQKYAIKQFINKLGKNWKTVLNYKWSTEDLDYYCYRNNIMDPIHDYINE